MTRKIIALASVAWYLVFFWSCAIYRYEKTPLVSVTPEKRTEVRISAVLLHSGEKAEFLKTPAAKIKGDSVVGTRIIENFKLEKSKIKQLGHMHSFQPGEVTKITTIDGMFYETERIKSQDDTSVTFDAYLPASIPLADVNFVWIEEVDVWPTFLLYVGLPIVILIAYGYYHLGI